MVSGKEEWHQLSIPFDRESAVLAQADWAKRCDVPLGTINSVGIEFILIPPGAFMCGNAHDIHAELLRQGRSTTEPQFQCILTKPLYVSRHRVTQEQYRRVMGVNPSAYAETGYLASHVTGLDTRSFPVEGVSWYDCIEACNNMSEREGLSNYYQFGEYVFRNPNGAITEAEVKTVGGTGYRLLTSAEWEWVARAGTTSFYFYGNDEFVPDWKIDIGRPWPVGAEPANNFGVYDLHMYAEEWTFDAYSHVDDVKGPLEDPVNLINIDSERVVRGLNCFARGMEVAGAAESRNFRVCRTIEINS